MATWCGQVPKPFEQAGDEAQIHDAVRRMEADGIDTILEIGPGKTLTSFVKKTAPGIQTYHIDTADDFEAVAEQLKGAAQ